MATVVRKPGPGSARLQALLEGLKADATTKVGWFASAKYPEGQQVAYIASIHEFGAGPIPPRPFFRPTIATQREAWRESLARGAKAIADGRLTAAQVLDAVGEKAAAEVARSITKVNAPALSEATIRARQRAKGGKVASVKPLQDTGYMLASLTHLTETT